MFKDSQFIYRRFTYKSPNITLGMSMHSSDSRKAVAELIFWYWNEQKEIVILEVWIWMNGFGLI
jgi:hypothetical protein